MPAFIDGAFGATPRPAGMLTIAGLCARLGNEGTAVITRENNKGVVRNTVCIERVEDFADLLIQIDHEVTARSESGTAACMQGGSNRRVHSGSGIE